MRVSYDFVNTWRYSNVYGSMKINLTFPELQAIVTFETCARPGAHVRVHFKHAALPLTGPAFIVRVAARRITVRLADEITAPDGVRFPAGARIVVPTIDGKGWSAQRRIAPL